MVLLLCLSLFVFSIPHQLVVLDESLSVVNFLSFLFNQCFFFFFVLLYLNFMKSKGCKRKQE